MPVPVHTLNVFTRRRSARMLERAQEITARAALEGRRELSESEAREFRRLMGELDRQAG